MTKRLYEESSKVIQWEATVLEVKEENDYCLITLDQTAFYPEGGGQPSDAGKIGDVSVLDVQKGANGEIIHKTKRRPSGKNVRCEIDWPRRLDHMQQHSGQHLLSAVCRELFDAKTLSFHLGREIVTIDIDSSDWDDGQTQEVERLANQYIYENRAFRTYFVTQEELKELSVVKMPKVTENIRIVEIEGIEYNPCGGTHVEQTGEIGMIKILKAEKQKGQTRLHFKCGKRALHDYSESLNVLNDLSAAFNTRREEVADRVAKLEAEHTALEAAFEKLKKENAGYLADSLLSQTEELLIMHVFEDKTMKDLQFLSQSLLEKANALLLLASKSENKVLITHGGSINIHCGDFLKNMLPSFRGKGGGNDKKAQASFTEKADFLAFYETAGKSLSEIIIETAYEH